MTTINKPVTGVTVYGVPPPHWDHAAASIT